MVERAEPRSNERRLEVVHESLLSQWPRLVRWRNQDAEGAQLRDDLRQAANRWEEKGRPEGLLWTGDSFKEFELWRNRYPGGLTASENAFAGAAIDHAQRQRRRQRAAVVTAFCLLLIVLGIVGFFWRQSDVARDRAEQEALRAEASKLLALGQLELDADHTAALAYATASLELADTREARLFALEALAKGPPGRVLEPADGQPRDELSNAIFSPDGAWLATSEHREIWVVGSDGKDLRRVGTFPSAGSYLRLAFSPEGDALLAMKYIEGRGEVRMWSVPGFEPVSRWEFADDEGLWPIVLSPTASEYLALFAVWDESGENRGWALMPLSADGAPGEMLRLPRLAALDWLRSWLGYVLDGESRQLYVRSLVDWGAPPRPVGRHEEEIKFIWFHPDDERIAVQYRSGEGRLWGIASQRSEPLALWPGRGFLDDRWEQRVSGELVAEGFRVDLWDLTAPAEASPLSWVSPGSLNEAFSPQFTPGGRWLTTEHGAGRALWPLTRPRPVVLPIPGDGDSLDMDLAFTADGRRLVSAARGEVRQWELGPGGKNSELTAAPGEGELSRRLSSGSARGRLAIDPEDRFLVVSTTEVEIVPFDSGPVRSLGETGGRTWPVAIDAEGRRVASSSWDGPAEAKAIRIWDLSSGEMRTLGPVEEAAEGFGGRQNDFEFLPGERFLSVGDGGLRLWDLAAGTFEVLAPSHIDSRLAVFGGGRYAAHTGEDNALVLTDLDTGTAEVLTAHGNSVSAVGGDPTGTVIISGSDDGALRVGPVAGEEPHILLGHQGRVKSVVVSPDGGTIASIAIDHTIRLWPMPDLFEPPLHTLPHEELLAKLRSLTNVRVVRDEDSPTGWSVDYDPFPGWEDVPEW